MITVGISEFRAQLNTFLQKVQQGEIIALTLRGEEVARIVPPNYARTAARKELVELRKTAVVGDVLSPVAESDEWIATQ